MNYNCLHLRLRTVLASSWINGGSLSAEGAIRPIVSADSRRKTSFTYSTFQEDRVGAVVNEYCAITPNVKLGSGVKLSKFINLYGCVIGDNTKIGAFVEIQKNATVGKNCKISSHTFVCEGVTIEDDVFIGHGVTFVNDTFPRATAGDGNLQTEADWKVELTFVKKRRFHRLGSYDSFQRYHRRKRDCGRRQCRNARCSREHDRGGKSGKGIAVHYSKYKGELMSQNAKIPFVDLVTPHRELQEELVNVFKATLATAGFIGGPMVEGFESDFAKYCDAKFCVGVNSGTDALRFALSAAGVGSGDVVLTVPNTFIATTEAISQTGARPDFVDVDPRTYTMDPEKLRHYLQTECELDSKTGRYCESQARAARCRHRSGSFVRPVCGYGSDS